jgi:hypothetical protein
MHEKTLSGGDLLPDFLRRALGLIGTMIVPQAILLFLNLRSWWLVAGEMDRNQSADALLLGIAAVALLGLGLAAALWMNRCRARLDWRHGMVLVVSHVAYLWAFTVQVQGLIPRSVPDWMLPLGTLLYYQFALIMPALLHGALLLAGGRSRHRPSVEVGSILGALVGVPLAGYALVYAADHARFGFRHVAPAAVLFVLFVGMTALLLTALLRGLMLLGPALHRGKGHGRMVLAVLVGLVGPVAGLMLNRRIPFPCDFQSAGVYGLAVLNGAVLLLPVAGPRRAHRWAWLAQCALFPFTAYFMMVFLPFLPLSLMAILAMGAGLLMLVPLLLAVVHAQQIVAGWRSAAQGSAVRAWTLGGVAAFCLLPAAFAGRAYMDRAALHAALGCVYSPDYSDGRLDINRGALRRGLESLRDVKAGLQLPLLGDYYNHVVFGGLVLPDEKLKTLYLAFFGRELPPAPRSRLGANLFGGSRQRTWGGWRGMRPSTNNVSLVSLDVTRAAEGDCETAVAKLVIRNDGDGQREYVTQLHVPAGVFVSGYWLHIGTERVAGRVFEKKAALWVYEMIRDMTRRDPGLLLYKDARTVELRVFPLEAGQARTTEIELIWPRGMAPPVRIADRRIDTASEAEAAPYVVAASTEEGRLLVASPSRLSATGAVPDAAPPYLHLVLDASEGAEPADMAERALAVARQVPGVRDVVVSTANYEFETAGPGLVPLARLEETIRAIRVTPRGGFCRDRALACVLAWRDKHAPLRGVVPVVILSPGPHVVVADEAIGFLAGWHPSTAGYLECLTTGAVRSMDFRRQPIERVALPSAVVSVEGARVRIPLAGDEPVACLLPAGPDGPAQVVNPRYRAAAAAWLLYARWLQNPAGRDAERGRIVEVCRAANVLTPLTAFIVVENSAQWRMLEQKERQKLKNADALDVPKASAPPTALLVAGLAAAWACRHLARRFSTRAADRS